MDNRLDYISNFINKDLAILEMGGCRRQFIELDELLKFEALNATSPEMLRSIENSRKHLEESCMHAIKALCLKHEDKQEA